MAYGLQAPAGAIDPASFAWENMYGTSSTASAATTPTAGFGFNMPSIGMGLSGLSTLGNIWNSFQAKKLAKEQLEFQKNFANTNLTNSIKSYNTQLGDRSRSRAAQEGQSAEAAQAYVDQNKLTR